MGCGGMAMGWEVDCTGGNIKDIIRIMNSLLSFCLFAITLSSNLI